MNILLVTSLMLMSFFAGFFLAWYAIRSAYRHKINMAIKTEVINAAAMPRRESSSIDLIDSSPEIVTVTNLPEEALNRYIDSITSKVEQQAKERMSRTDEPTLKIGKSSKENSVSL